jgi:hypothetical protein
VGAEFDVPADLIPAPGQGLEGPAAVFEGGGVRLTLDASLFADPLTGHGDKPGFTQRHDRVGGEERQIVSYAAGEDTRVFATRLTGLTATVHVQEAADPETALRILRSIRPMSRH